MSERRVATRDDEDAPVAGRDTLSGRAISGERGDELPEGLRTSGGRRTLLREAKQALEAARAAQAKKFPRDRSSGWSSAGVACGRTGSSSGM